MSIFFLSDVGTLKHRNTPPGHFKTRGLDGLFAHQFDKSGIRICPDRHACGLLVLVLTAKALPIPIKAQSCSNLNSPNFHYVMAQVPAAFTTPSPTRPYYPVLGHGGGYPPLLDGTGW